MLKVLMVASEAFPLAKSGGLADAVSGLAHAVQQAGVEITLLLPGYRQALQALPDTKEVAQLPDLPGGPATLVLGWIAQFNLPVLLLRNDALYDRDGGLYLDANGEEYADNDLRFAALSHAAVAIAAAQTPLALPHVIHANDWHTGLIPLLLKAAGINRIKSVLTVHNLAFQGLFPLERAAELGIPPAWRGDEGAECWGRLSYMKAGLRHADRITTVSRTYAHEILTPEHGMGLDPLLNQRRQDLVAIPNGIDTNTWNPALDILLPFHYSAYDLTGKQACKRELQRLYGLALDPGATVLVQGSRLTTQKMGDVAVEALPRMLDAHPSLQVAILGRGESGIEAGLRRLAARYPGRAAIHIGYDEKRAHLLHAGGDILLHGSRFEPFGLTPLYAMTYGTIPVCSAVGGMLDTIIDVRSGDSAAGTGILFHGETADAMAAAIDQAMALRRQPRIWQRMQQNGMTKPFGWEQPAALYMELYRSLAPIYVKVPQAPAYRARQPLRGLPAPLDARARHTPAVSSSRLRALEHLPAIPL